MNKINRSFERFCPDCPDILRQSLSGINTPFLKLYSFFQLRFGATTSPQIYNLTLYNDSHPLRNYQEPKHNYPTNKRTKDNGGQLQTEIHPRT